MSEEDHTKNLSSSMKGIYEKLKQTILDLGDIDIDVKNIMLLLKAELILLIFIV